MSLYFISDLHLQTDKPCITQGFLSYIAALPDDAEALYILGDFFEYWVGDDDRNDLIDQVQTTLSALKKRGVTLYFQHGNRDFLLGKQYADRCGMTLLDEEHVIDYDGTRYLLMHGDSLCTSDTEYMAFRQQSRNPEWQAMMLSLSLEERHALAKNVRDTSQTETRMKADDITDVTQAAVEERMRANDVQQLIHGHTHRPKQHEFNLSESSATRHVLGDWSDTNGWDIRLSANGVVLNKFAHTDHTS